MRQLSRPDGLAALRWLLPAGLLLLLALPVEAAGAVAVDPELAPGQKLVAKRQWDKAESWFYDFVKAHPDHAGALRQLGLVELRRPGGDVVRARQYLRTRHHRRARRSHRSVSPGQGLRGQWRCES
ncbi:MAG: hypothetical protein Q9Q13_01755 [Acidobacteriota bacterium]|nr:hypothetical protein [Acidobacteriota bacterium]